MGATTEATDRKRNWKSYEDLVMWARKLRPMGPGKRAEIPSTQNLADVVELMAEKIETLRDEIRELERK